MKYPVVVALNGNPGSGKDAIADFLVEDFGFVKLSFSEALREMCAVLNPIVGVMMHLEDPITCKVAPEVTRG